MNKNLPRLLSLWLCLSYLVFSVNGNLFLRKCIHMLINFSYAAKSDDCSHERRIDPGGLHSAVSWMDAFMFQGNMSEDFPFLLTDIRLHTHPSQHR